MVGKREIKSQARMNQLYTSLCSIVTPGINIQYLASALITALQVDTGVLTRPVAVVGNTLIDVHTVLTIGSVSFGASA